jgi:hypothetical protein
VTAVLKSATGVSIAESILNDIVSKNSIYYYYFGKILSWNPLGLDNPEVPSDYYKYELATRSNIISTKRILESDVSYVIRRIDWVSGLVFDMYDDSYSLSNLSSTGKSSLDEANFYVVTDVNNVYKCIGNNYGAISTVKPTGVDSDVFTTADGYIWKFMYNIPIGYKNKFYDGNYIPVTTAIKNKFYSGGNIDLIIIDNPGTGYVDGTTYINVTGDGYLAENPHILTDIIVTNTGYGYATDPAVTISSPITGLGTDIQATATSVRTATAVTDVNIATVGFGYDTSATVSVAEPIAVYSNFVPGMTLTLNTKVKYLGNYYNTSTAGTCGSSVPVHTTGAVTNGTAVLTYVATRATAYLTFTKTNAIITPIISSGQVTGAIITNGGIGYSYISLSVTGVGTGALVSADLSSGDLNTLQANVEFLAVDGSLSYIKVDNQGSGYSNATVVISGNGTGATADAVIVGGKISKITMTNVGSGYTNATATIVGNGTNCVLRPIISPKGGHGKNAIYEFNARTLMFFTSMASINNQGISISNDNRQLGIIKSPTKYNSNILFRGTIGSTCYLLTMPSAINITNFQKDMTLSTGNKKYNIVDISGNKMLVTSISGYVPILGETLLNDNSDAITPTNITPPTIDKYSGNMLFIDNRNAFNTTAEQSLSLRTTIQF